MQKRVEPAGAFRTMDGRGQFKKTVYQLLYILFLNPGMDERLSQLGGLRRGQLGYFNGGRKERLIFLG